MREREKTMRGTTIIALLSLCLCYSYQPSFRGIGSWKHRQMSKLQLGARRASDALGRQRSKVQRGSQKEKDEEEEDSEDSEEDEGEKKKDESQDVVFPPDEEYWEEATRSGLMEELYPLPAPNRNAFPNDYTNFRFTKEDADALITLEDLARGHRRPVLVPDSEEERQAREAEESGNVGYPIYHFQKRYLLLGFFDSDDEEVLERRGELFDYHLQWGRRTQLANEIRIRKPFITDTTVTSVFEPSGASKELLSAKVLVEEEFTLLDDDRLKPVGQALIVTANATSDLQQYLAIEPLQNQGVLTSPGWVSYELKRDEVTLTSFNASLAADVFRPYYVMGTSSWNISQVLKTARQITSSSILDVLARRCEEETALLVQQIRHLTAPLAQNKRRRHLLYLFSSDKSRSVPNVIEEVAKGCEGSVARLRAVLTSKKKSVGGKEFVYQAVKEVLVERWKLHLLATQFLKEYSLFQYQHGDLIYPEGLGEGLTLLMNQAEMEDDADVDEETGEAGEGRFLYNRLEDLYKRESGGEFFYRGRSRVCSYTSVLTSDHDSEVHDNEEVREVVRDLTSFLVQHNLDGSSWRHIGVQMVLNGASLNDVRRFLQCDPLIPHFTTSYPSSEKSSSKAKQRDKVEKVEGEEVNDVNGLPKNLCQRLSSSSSSSQSRSQSDREEVEKILALLLPTRQMMIAPMNVQDVDGLYRLGVVFPTSDAVGELDPDDTDNIQQFMFTNIREFHDMDTQDFLKVEHSAVQNDVINRQENYRVLNLLKRSGVGALFREFNENAVDMIESSNSLITPLLQAASEKRKAAGLSDEEEGDQRKAVRERRGKKRKSATTSEDDEGAEESFSEGDEEDETEEVEEDDIDLLLVRSGRSRRRRDEGRPIREDYDSGDSGMGDW